MDQTIKDRTLFIRLFILIASFSMDQRCYGQYHPMAIETANWIVFSLQNNEPNHYILSLGNDTIINDISYQKIIKRRINSEATFLSDFIPPYETTSNSQLIGFVRDDILLQHVYAIEIEEGITCNPGREELLYDFSLFESDTISGCLFDEGYVEGSIIERITREQIWNETRRIYQMIDPDFKYIEGIGGNAGIFSTHALFILGNFEELVYYCIGDYETCGITVVKTENVINDDKVIAYPNPTTKQITIDLSNAQYRVLKIVVFNAIGQIVSRQEYSEGTNDKIILPLGPLENEVCFLQLEMENGQRLIKRIQLY